MAVPKRKNLRVDPYATCRAESEHHDGQGLPAMWRQPAISPGFGPSCGYYRGRQVVTSRLTDRHAYSGRCDGRRFCPAEIVAGARLKRPVDWSPSPPFIWWDRKTPSAGNCKNMGKIPDKIVIPPRFGNGGHGGNSSLSLFERRRITPSVDVVEMVEGGRSRMPLFRRGIPGPWWSRQR